MIRLRCMSVKPWTVFDSRVCELGEGPHYDERSGRVWWVDILGCRILWRAFDGPDNGEIPAPAHVGAAIPRLTEGLLACLPWGVVMVSPDCGWSELSRYPIADERLRSNDAKADPAGRLWLGTMSYAEDPGLGTLYRLNPGAGTPTAMLTGVTVSNGLGWSPDGLTMYYIDSPTCCVDAFDFDMNEGTLGRRRTFARIDSGFPDGLCIDAHGGVWVAIWDGARVMRFLPDGSLDRVLPLPVPRVTSCAFAGPRFDVLIVTTVGPTYAFALDDVVGLPAHRFAG